jgi:hypothetical protein
MLSQFPTKQQTRELLVNIPRRLAPPYFASWRESYDVRSRYKLLSGRAGATLGGARHHASMVRAVVNVES